MKPYSGCRLSGSVLFFSISWALAAQDLKVTLLGTGSPIPTMDRFGPSALVEAGREKLLIDCGRGASQRLWQLRIPLGAVTAVFLTHLHSDHVVGIPDLWLTGWLGTPFGNRPGPFEIFGPSGTRQMMTSLENAFQPDIRFRVAEGMQKHGLTVLAEDITTGVIYQKNGVTVTAFEVDHVNAKPALGYRIDYGERSVVFSGDTRQSESVIDASKGVDVLVHEVAWARPELLAKSELARIVMGLHTTPEEAATVFSKVKPRLAVYSHIVLFTSDPRISPPTAAEVLQESRKTYAGRLEVGEDLLTINIGDQIAIRRSAVAAR